MLTRGALLPAAFGVVGVLLLASLGVWQLERLEQKRARLVEIATSIRAEPGPLPDMPDPDRDGFRPVAVEGRIAGPDLRVVLSTAAGPAWRVISPFETDDRRILLDRGTIRADAEVPPPPPGPVEVVGNLHWPEEVDGFTPEPDLGAGLWYARDVPAMAAALDTEPVLVVARATPGDAVDPLPVDGPAIPNNHLAYAVQWFALAAVWAGMTLYLLWRIRRRQV